MIRHALLVAVLLPMVVLAQETQDLPASYSIEGHFDTFTTDEMGNAYALQGDELKLFDARGRTWLRNSTKTFGRIGGIDAFYSLKPMLFAPEQGQIAVLDNTLSLQGSVINLPSQGYPQVVGACMSVQNCFWFFDQQEMAVIRVDGQLRSRANSGRLDQVLGFTVEPVGMMEYDSRLYVNDPKKGILVFDLFGTYVRTIGITGARSMQVRGTTLFFLDAEGAHACDLRTFAIEDFPTGIPAATVRDMRVESGRIFLLLEDRIAVQAYR